MGTEKPEGPYRPLYIAATGEHAGKSAIALGLCLALRKRGLNTGYFKPVGFPAAPAGSVTADADALQAREVLGLDDAIGDLCPVVLSADMIDSVMSGKKRFDPAEMIRAAFGRIAVDRDIVVIEGLGDPGRGAFMGASGADVAAMVGARTLLVAGYGETAMLDRILAAGLLLKDSMLGVIFNLVPRGRLEQVDSGYRQFLDRRGIEVFGTIKSNPRLSAVSVGAIRERLDAEWLCAEGESGRLAESLLIGAMNQEHALRYFQRVADKVVITGGDRADIILAALETPTAAVVLTGNFRPAPSVIGRAEELKVPLLLTGIDTLSAVREVQELFGRLQAQEESKLELITELVEKQVDLEVLLVTLGAGS